jgi:predicted DNA-binding protein YlxM (UPF0122 family)
MPEELTASSPPETEHLDISRHVPRKKRILTVQAVAQYLSRGLRPPDIAKIYGISKQAVYQFIRNHEEKLKVLHDNSDRMIALQSKLTAWEAMKKISSVLSHEKFEKKDLIPLNAISGTHIQRYRELTGKAIESGNVKIVLEVKGSGEDDGNVKTIDITEKNDS